MTRKILLAALLVVAATSLVAVGAAGGSPADHDKGMGKSKGHAKAKGKSVNSATPVFTLKLQPKREVPPVKNLKADAIGHVTFDLERNAQGAITSGEVIFYFNYKFPGAVNIIGLHIHSGGKKANGPIVVNSGLAANDGDGQGNLTAIITGVAPADLQAILDNPRNYYVNLHTDVNPGGALRAQLNNPKKR